MFGKYEAAETTFAGHVEHLKYLAQTANPAQGEKDVVVDDGACHEDMPDTSLSQEEVKGIAQAAKDAMPSPAGSIVDPKTPASVSGNFYTDSRGRVFKADEFWFKIIKSIKLPGISTPAWSAASQKQKRTWIEEHQSKVQSNVDAVKDEHER